MGFQLVDQLRFPGRLSQGEAWDLWQAFVYDVATSKRPASPKVQALMWRLLDRATEPA